MRGKSGYPQASEREWPLERRKRRSLRSPTLKPTRQNPRKPAVHGATREGEMRGLKTDWSSEWDSKPRDSASIFCPQFHSPGHPFHQPMLRRSITKPIQINALNLVGKIGSPSSFGENPPIRIEKARPFRLCTIKVSGEKPANTQEFPSPPWAESMFA